MSESVVSKPVVSEAVASTTKPVKPGTCAICGKPVHTTSDGIGATCKSHIGHLREYATSAQTPPEGYIRMSKVCDAAEKVGLTRSQVVTACGGDAATKPLLAPYFQPCYVGRGKWLSPEVISKGFALIKEGAKLPAPEASKPSPKAPQAVSDIANSLKQVKKPA